MINACGADPTDILSNNEITEGLAGSYNCQNIDIGDGPETGTVVVTQSTGNSLTLIWSISQATESFSSNGSKVEWIRDDEFITFEIGDGNPSLSFSFGTTTAQSCEKV